MNIDNKKYDILDTNTKCGKFIDEYITNSIISSNMPSDKYKDGVDTYYSLNGFLGDQPEQHPNYMN